LPRPADALAGGGCGIVITDRGMAMDELSILKASDAVTSPVPSADPARVARWLERVRLGALCGLGVAICCATQLAVYTVLWVAGVTPWPRPSYAVAYAIGIVEGVVAWVLVSSEPRNLRWLWPWRWILRLAAATIVLSCAVFMVAYGFFWPVPPKSTGADGVWERAWMYGTVGCWMLFFWYLKKLAHRLGDVGLRRNFNVLFWLLGILSIAALLTLIYKAWPDHDPAQSASAPASGEAEIRPIALSLRWLAVLMAFHTWTVWLMWRLSRRLNRAAAHYRGLGRLLAAPEPQPI